VRDWRVADIIGLTGSAPPLGEGSGPVCDLPADRIDLAAATITGAYGGLLRRDAKPGQRSGRPGIKAPRVQPSRKALKVSRMSRGMPNKKLPLNGGALLR
jgi:hypothetical protein